MKRILISAAGASLLTILISVCVFGSGGEKPVSAKEAKTESRIDQAAGQIKANGWFGGVDKNAIPTMLEGNLYWGAKGGDRIEESYRFLENHKELFRMDNPRQELKPEGVIGPDGISPIATVKFIQVVNGVKVRYGGYNFHFNADGLMNSLNGQIDPDAKKVNTNPAISEEQVKQIALNDTLNAGTKAEVIDLELMIARYEEGLRLVWSFGVIYGGPPGSWLYKVDAQTGKVLEVSSAFRR